VGGPLDPLPGGDSSRPPPAFEGGPPGSALTGGAPDPLGPVLEGGSPDPLGPVFEGGSLEAPELAPGVDPSDPLDPLGADAPPVPMSGEDAAPLPPLSDDEPLEEGPSFDDDDDVDDDDDPESLGPPDEPKSLELDPADEPKSLELDPADEPDSLELDPADEPDSLEPPDDGSLGDIGASAAANRGGMAALAAPAPVQSTPTPRPVTNAAQITRCFVPMVRPLGTPRQCRRLQTGAVTYLRKRCQPSGLIPLRLSGADEPVARRAVKDAIPTDR
jgi:hypothetical protein